MSHSKTLTIEDAVQEAMDGRTNVILCPAHDDKSPSLSVAPGKTQPVLFHCHAGCETDAIIAAGGLDWSEVCAPLDVQARTIDSIWTPAGAASKVYAYTDMDGVILYEVFRVDQAGGGKRMLQCRPDPEAPSGRAWNLEGVQRVLFKLPLVAAAVAGGYTIHVAEGEKCAEALAPLLPEGEVSTTNPQGAGKWQPEFSEVLTGANVVLYADSDDAGRAHMRSVRESLLAVGCTVRTVEAPAGVVARSGKAINDVADHIEAGLGLDGLITVTPEVAVERAMTGIDVLDLIKRPKGKTEWALDGTLAKGERLVLIGFEGTGKALALDTPIPTPKGWSTMADLSVGQEVFSPSGEPVRIEATTEVLNDRPCYRVEFSDGSSIIADAQHQWVTDDRPSREAAARFRKGGDQTRRLHRSAVRTTIEIRDSLRAGNSWNHSVTTTEPLQYPAQELPLDPYLVGAWLGDGHSACARITCENQEILDRLDTPLSHVSGITWALTDGVMAGPRKPSIQRTLRQMGLLNNKHIPEAYLFAGVEQRIALMQGLMDTDGTVDKRGRCEFSVCNERLARDFYALALGLGIKATIKESDATLNGRVVGRRWRIGFYTDLPVVSLPRKAERMVTRPTARASLRYIVGVWPVESVPVRCIQVEGEVYLAGEQCIPTHNSTLFRQIAVMAAGGLHPFTHRPMKESRKVLYIDGENHPDQTLESWQQLVGLAARHDFAVPPGQLIVLEEWAGARDLCTAEGTAWLVERIHAYQPDLCLMGPLTNMADKDLRDDEPVRRIKKAVDQARTICNTAFIMEHHAPLKGSMDKERPMRPYGSSLFLKWPDYGYGIKPTEDEGVFEWYKNRGPRVRSREWPEGLREGQPNSLEWPWQPCIFDQDGRVIR